MVGEASSELKKVRNIVASCSICSEHDFKNIEQKQKKIYRKQTPNPNKPFKDLFPFALCT